MCDGSGTEEELSLNTPSTEFVTKFEDCLHDRHVHIVEVYLQILPEPLSVTIVIRPRLLPLYVPIQELQKLSTRFESSFLAPAGHDQGKTIVSLNWCGVPRGFPREDGLELWLRIGWCRLG